MKMWQPGSDDAVKTMFKKILEELEKFHSHKEAMGCMKESLKATQGLVPNNKKRKLTSDIAHLHFGPYTIITAVSHLSKKLGRGAKIDNSKLDDIICVGIQKALHENGGCGDMTWFLDMQESVEPHVNDMMHIHPYNIMFAHADVGDVKDFIRKTICSIFCKRTETVIHGVPLNDHMDDEKEEYLILHAFLDLFVRFRSGCVAIKDQMADLIRLFREAKPCNEEIPDTFEMFAKKNRVYLLALAVMFALQNLLVEGSSRFYAQHEERLQSEIGKLLVTTNRELSEIIDKRFLFDWQLRDVKYETEAIQMLQQKTVGIMQNRMEDWYDWYNSKA